ncbi:ABC transporter permease [Bacillus sp. JCM 19041]|uniref:ABC transporter permease n=1 Tax=Bacillus sp. JCM 19041 TaxID=1460637 RepID=UPI0006D0FB09
MTVLMHSYYMARRHILELARSPYIIAMNIIQPILYLLLFSALFQAVVDIPGFNGGSYLSYFGPGIVIMSTVIAGCYGGLTMVMDEKQGILDRFLVSPANRFSLLAGPLLKDIVTMIIQAVIMIGLASILGARFDGGMIGVFVLIVFSVFVGLAFGALSLALALVVRNEQALTSIVGFMQMPILFLSSLFMPLDLVPNWVEVIAKANPVNWSIEGAREALTSDANWIDIWICLGMLACFAFLSVFIAMQAFKNYQRKR